MNIGHFDLTNTQYANIPSQLIYNLEQFLRHGYYPGDFLASVLNNDLKEAIGRADNESLKELRNLVSLIRNHFPGRFLKAGSVKEFQEDSIRYVFASIGFVEWIETDPVKAKYVNNPRFVELGA
jgi:hypothetical protein